MPPRRRAITKAPAIKRPPSTTGGVGVHAHGCITCHGRYEDTCVEPNSNASCVKCRGLQPWQLLIDDRLPRVCCRTYSKPATKDQLKHDRLSTACSWFRCPKCARTFPYDNPSKESA